MLFRSFEQFDVIPDVLLLGKALGGGMPLGAFIADINMMQSLTENPVLGHINTFGGHPVCCAAGLAALEVLKRESLVEHVFEKEKLFRSLLIHPTIRKLNSRGLMMALFLDSYEQNKKLIDKLIERGVFTDWFLFASNALRIAPPLTISEQEIRKACAEIISVLNEIS